MYYANYNKAVRIAMEVLEDFDISQAPVNLETIFDGMEFEISKHTYKEFQEKYNKTWSETIAFMNSDRGAVTICDRKSATYLIYYDDSLSDGLIRFNLAHELGHVFLEHCLSNAVDRMTSIPKDLYDELEKEANVFARNLLTPAPLAWDLMSECKINPNAHMTTAFGITHDAANMRINMVRRDLKDYTEEMTKKVKRIHLQYQRCCLRCSTFVPKGALYCSSCGYDRIGYSLHYQPQPVSIKIDSHGIPMQCPVCRNDDIADDAQFCIICGNPLRNICYSDRPGLTLKKYHINPTNARYCTTCGSETVYKRFDIATKYEEEESMQYNDGVAYDEDTLRVNICPVCNNEQFSSNAEFCRICGTNLYNKCEGDMDYDMNNEPYYRNQHNNPSNARFCEICGKPTYFFSKKILVPHTEYNKPIKVQATVTEPYPFNPDEAAQDRIEIEAEKYDYIPNFDEELPFN
jgi:Zn-dependent peptidase ImmA (M78 family)